MSQTYQPKKRKRAKAHGFLVRSKSKTGRICDPVDADKSPEQYIKEEVLRHSAGLIDPDKLVFDIHQRVSDVVSAGAGGDYWACIWEQ